MMEPLFLVGIIILTGFVFGELAIKIRLPKVTGYIIAGIVLDPDLLSIIPQDFSEHTEFITNIALSFITFSIGGTLLFQRVKRLGKGILSITLFESEFAFLAVTLGFLILPTYLFPGGGPIWFTTIAPISILLGAMASPTDPSTTLAITHEYKAKGDVTSTIMGVASFDDAVGIFNYSLAIAVASRLILHQGFNAYTSIIVPIVMVISSIIFGIVSGVVFNAFTSLLRKQSEGALIVVISGALLLFYGAAELISVDSLLTTMAMGVTVVNLNPLRKEIFRTLERYTEELIFVLFFTLSGMHLDFSILFKYLNLVLAFILFRTIGKLTGTWLGASLSKSSQKVKRYTTGGLIPQGGIVIGLALLIKQNAAFDAISGIILSQEFRS